MRHGEAGEKMKVTDDDGGVRPDVVPNISPAPLGPGT